LGLVSGCLSLQDLPVKLPLEDHAGDVCAKAMRGHRIAPLEAAKRAGLASMDVDAVTEGRAGVETYRALAPVLHLHADSLCALAGKRWAPEPVSVEGLVQLNLPCDDMQVNVFIVFDPTTQDAVVFDTAASPALVHEKIRSLGCRVRRILLTHEHWDHVEGADELARLCGAPVEAIRGANLEGVTEFEDGAQWKIGSLSVRALFTPGHAVAGATFLVTGLARPVAIVGDTLFAGSAGGARSGFAEALRIVRERILSLPGETILASGHGPLTTVAEENAHNPFFAR
jgi:hydroxyacylglutathione hydrolase